MYGKAHPTPTAGHARRCGHAILQTAAGVVQRLSVDKMAQRLMCGLDLCSRDHMGRDCRQILASRFRESASRVCLGLTVSLPGVCSGEGGQQAVNRSAVDLRAIPMGVSLCHRLFHACRHNWNGERTSKSRAPWLLPQHPALRDSPEGLCACFRNLPYCFK